MMLLSDHVMYECWYIAKFCGHVTTVIVWLTKVAPVPGGDSLVCE
jgi:hypothetical protein